MGSFINKDMNNKGLDKFSLLLLLTLFLPLELLAREQFSLNKDWSSVCYPEGRTDSMTLRVVDLPHNWDDYYGYRQYMHGNLHGKARYEKSFSLFSLTRNTDVTKEMDRLYTLRIEGAGTYITVWVNDHKVCEHRPVGRVTSSIDITSFLHTKNPTATNKLIIECEHPSMQTDMPWVCGGCSSEWGFSEGSAPFGLFRNVSLEMTDKLRIEPFGVHVWCNATLDTLFVDTEVRNNNSHADAVVLQTIVNGKLKKVPFQMGSYLSKTIHQEIPVEGLKPWSPEDPQLYDITSVLIRGSRHDIEADRVITTTGFSRVKWPHRSPDGKVDDSDHRFYINGKATFINGICEYEHMLGNSHALGKEEIDYRVDLVKRMGFNAFRDAHQPHNLRYGDELAKAGVMWWPQFSAHIWYDTQAFRNNFKTLLRQWVKERRNNPAVILWGLQNESTLPEDFARECSEIIREMDPRQGLLITTCNGGSGTDWNVVQNWSGTYGGKLSNYGEELSKDDQLLNGEYGGWRTVGLHDKQDRMPGATVAQMGEAFDPKAPWSEEHMCVLLHEKMRQAWLYRDRLCGHFEWLLSSHDNPGRQQPDEYLTRTQKIGPLNYKGLLTAAWEPTDAYYLYRAWGLFFQGEWPATAQQPTELTAREMVKIGYKADEVPLPDYLLEEDAVGDCSRPNLHTFARQTSLLKPEEDHVYLYRYNCAGDELIDSWGNRWMGDDSRYCSSWAQLPQFERDRLSPVLGSYDWVRGWVVDPADTLKQLLAAQPDQALLRSYRFGRHQLKFRFPLPEGFIYQVDLWFVDNQHEVRRATYRTQRIEQGSLLIAFPKVKVGQTKISAIAISIDKKSAKQLGKMEKDVFVFKPEFLYGPHPALVREKGYPYSAGLTWADLSQDQVDKTDKAQLPADKGGREAKKYLVETSEQGNPLFNIRTGLAQEYALRFRYKNTTGAPVSGHWQLLPQQDGGVVAEGDITFPVTPDKFKIVSTTTGTFVNAGNYRLVVTGSEGAVFDTVEVQ